MRKTVRLPHVSLVTTLWHSDHHHNQLKRAMYLSQRSRFLLRQRRGKISEEQAIPRALIDELEPDLSAPYKRSPSLLDVLLSRLYRCLHLNIVFNIFPGCLTNNWCWPFLATCSKAIEVKTFLYTGSIVFLANSVIVIVSVTKYKKALYDCKNNE